MAKSIEEIAAEVEEWGILERLPKKIGEFEICTGEGINGQILEVASYVNKEMRCKLQLTYTGETFDYVPVKHVGMHVFRDVRFFARDREHFEEQVMVNLPKMLNDIDRHVEHQPGFEANVLNWGEWEYWQKLPKKIGDYELYITPDNILPYINGSFIFLDYSDFAKQNQIYFLYNNFRNEIFAEMKQDGMPLTTNVFDVPANIPDDKKLVVLTELLEKHLETMLQKL